MPLDADTAHATSARLGARLRLGRATRRVGHPRGHARRDGSCGPRPASRAAASVAGDLTLLAYGRCGGLPRPTSLPTSARGARWCPSLAPVCSRLYGAATAPLRQTGAVGGGARARRRRVCRAVSSTSSTRCGPAWWRSGLRRMRLCVHVQLEADIHFERRGAEVPITWASAATSRGVRWSTPSSTTSARVHAPLRAGCHGHGRGGRGDDAARRGHRGPRPLGAHSRRGHDRAAGARRAYESAPASRRARAQWQWPTVAVRDDALGPTRSCSRPGDRRRGRHHRVGYPDHRATRLDAAGSLVITKEA